MSSLSTAALTVEAMAQDAADTKASIAEMQAATVEGMIIQQEATHDNSVLQGNALAGMLLKTAYDNAKQEIG